MEEETLEANFASFEEWPLEAIQMLKGYPVESSDMLKSFLIPLQMTNWILQGKLQAVAGWIMENLYTIPTG